MTPLGRLLLRIVAFDEEVLASARRLWQEQGTANRAAWVACGVVVAALAVT